MQTLGKLRHEQFPPARQRAAQQAEKQQVRGHERRVWRRRLWLFGRIAALVPVVWLVATLGFAWGRTAEGLVHCDVVTEVAPARVRVRRLAVAPGQRVARGDLLVELEPLLDAALDADREVLAQRLRRSRVRLELVRAGAVLDEVDASGRRDALELAQQELVRAQGDVARCAAEVQVQQRQRERLLAAAEQAALARRGEVQRLDAELAGARAAVQQAEAAAARLGQRIVNEQQLLHEGAQAGEAVAELRRASVEAEQEVAARAALVRGLVDARAVAEQQVALQQTAQARDVAAADAAIARVEAELAAAERAVAVWAGAAARRAAELPAGVATPAELRTMQLGMLEAEVAEREAELAAYDRRAGRVALRAGADGVVDRVFAVTGQVLEAGDAVLEWFDPRRVWVEALLPLELVAEVSSGDGHPGVSIVLPDGQVVAGAVGELAKVYAAPPTWSQAAVTDPAQRLLPARIAADPTRLPPNQRVRVVLPW